MWASSGHPRHTQKEDTQMKIPFSSENKVKSDFDFPKLYLDHGERARIVCIESEPEVEFVHTLKAPAIINGEVVMEKVKNKDGTISEKPKMDFVGRHICFGKPNVLFDPNKGGKDPESCPTCAEAQQNDAVGPAIRRMAMHVIQYKTQPGKFQIQTPFQADLKVWAFTDRMYSTLTDIAEEHGDLRKKDLLLGPCENKMFQNFDIQVGGTAEWLADPANTAFVKEVYAANKLESLTPAIARKISREMAHEDIQKVLLKHAQAFGGGGSGATAQVDNTPAAAASSMDLEGLLSGGDSTAPAASPEPTPAAASDPMALEMLDVPAAEPEATPAASEEPKEDKKAFDLDDLLSGL